MKFGNYNITNLEVTICIFKKCSTLIIVKDVDIVWQAIAVASTKHSVIESFASVHESN